MPKISSFMYGESVSQMITPQGPKPVLVGPIQIIITKAIPTNFTFGIVLGVQGIDISASHQIKITFETPDGQTDPTIIQDSKLEADLNPQNKLLAEYNGIMGSFMLQNIFLEKEGIYKTVVEIDGKYVGEAPIQVKKIGD